MNLTDQINMTHPLRAEQTAFGIASGIQDNPPAEQVIATAMLLLVFTDEFGLCVRDVLAKARSVLGDADQFDKRQIAALKQLIREEYLK